jgi:uncharacterized protein (TIGR03118 family)
VVAIPPPAGGTPPAAPTGMVFNDTSAFEVAAGGPPARFIFATEDGTISAWNTGTNAVLGFDNSASGTVYKSLALASSGGSNFLYAADFHHARIDVFDGSFRPVTLPGAFSDPAIPAGYAPFGIHNLGGNLYVTYAMQDANKHDDVAGPGHGYVDLFDSSGHLVKRFVSGDPLDSPWGMALAPAGFAQFSGDLLISNFGGGRINAFDAATGAFKGPLTTTNGAPIEIDGIWALKFGNGGSGGDGGRLYFTAGIAGGGNLEDHGLFGSISAVPGIKIASISNLGTKVTISWAGGTGPYTLQMKHSLSDPNWVDVQTTPNLTTTVTNNVGQGFLRIRTQ